MKKLKLLSFIVILVLILTSTIVFADNTFVLKLQPNSKELQREETLYLKVVLTSDATENGIQGYQANLTFDPAVFELQKNNANLDAYTENGKYDATVTNTQILLTDNSLNKIDVNAVTVTIPLKVKEDAEYGKTDISISSIEGSYVDLNTGATSESTGTGDKITLNIAEAKQEETVTLSKIQVTADPDKTSYKVGEKFDKTGMQVNAFYTDNSSSIITNYTYSPTGELTVNDKEIIIKYKEGNIEKETALPITVTEDKVIVEVTKLGKIAITKEPSKTSYKVGEKFNKEGMEVTAYYTDGTTKVITDYTYSPTAELTENDKEVTIKYKDGDIEKEEKVSITVGNNENKQENDTKQENNENKQENDTKQENNENKQENDIKQENNENKQENNAKQEQGKSEETKTIVETKTLESNKQESGNKIPQTGMPGILIPSIVGICLITVAIVCFKKYKKLK